MKKGYLKCSECGLYVLNLFKQYKGSPTSLIDCPRCQHGWARAEDFGWINLRSWDDTQHCNYWVVSVNQYLVDVKEPNGTWGWIATTWLKSGECIQIKKLNLLSFAGCKASWTLFAKKHNITYFEFE